MGEEIWRDIQGYENLYQVSSIGRVRSLNYNGTKKIQILKQTKSTKGYLLVWLYKEKNRKQFAVHRLVAEAFVENPENKPQVDHIDTDKTNNYYKNLHFVTPSENCNNPITSKHHSEAIRGEKHPMYKKHHSEESKRKMSEAKSKRVEIFKEGVSLGVFPSVRSIENQSEALFNVKLEHGNISAVCRGKQKHHKNYTFKYVD